MAVRASKRSKAITTAVVALLAGSLLLSAYWFVDGYIRRRLDSVHSAVHEGRLSSCRAYLAQIKQALKVYEIDHAVFPPISPGLSILAKPRSLSGGRTGSAYMEFRTGVGGIPLDVWGNPLVYRLKGPSSDFRSVILYSVGPNGVDEAGKGDDVAD